MSSMSCVGLAVLSVLLCLLCLPLNHAIHHHGQLRKLRTTSAQELFGDRDPSFTFTSTAQSNPALTLRLEFYDHLTKLINDALAPLNAATQIPLEEKKKMKIQVNKEIAAAGAGAGAGAIKGTNIGKRPTLDALPSFKFTDKHNPSCQKFNMAEPTEIKWDWLISDWKKIQPDEWTSQTIQQQVQIIVTAKSIATAQCIASLITNLQSTRPTVSKVQIIAIQDDKITPVVPETSAKATPVQGSSLQITTMMEIEEDGYIIRRIGPVAASAGFCMRNDDPRANDNNKFRIITTFHGYGDENEVYLASNGEREKIGRLSVGYHVEEDFDVLDLNQGHTCQCPGNRDPVAVHALTASKWTELMVQARREGKMVHWYARGQMTQDMKPAQFRDPRYDLVWRNIPMYWMDGRHRWTYAHLIVTERASVKGDSGSALMLLTPPGGVGVGPPQPNWDRWVMGVLHGSGRLNLRADPTKPDSAQNPAILVYSSYWSPIWAIHTDINSWEQQRMDILTRGPGRHQIC